MNKQSLRQQLSEQRLKLPTETAQQKSHTICKKIITLPEFKNAQNIACYLAFQNEVNLTTLMQAATDLNKKVYLPFLREKQMTFHLYQPGDTLNKNAFGLLEPTTDTKTIDSKQLDLVLVPLVGFDETGHRLGRGGGYYDRAFAYLHHERPTQKPLLFGVAYDFQKTHTLIDKHDWDVSLNAAVTEERVYAFS